MQATEPAPASHLIRLSSSLPFTRSQHPEKPGQHFRSLYLAAPGTPPSAS